jgi:hypothetical protein
MNKQIWKWINNVQWAILRSGASPCWRGPWPKPAHAGRWGAHRSLRCGIIGGASMSTERGRRRAWLGRRNLIVWAWRQRFHSVAAVFIGGGGTPMDNNGDDEVLKHSGVGREIRFDGISGRVANDQFAQKMIVHLI